MSSGLTILIGFIISAVLMLIAWFLSKNTQKKNLLWAEIERQKTEIITLIEQAVGEGQKGVKPQRQASVNGGMPVWGKWFMAVSVVPLIGSFVMAGMQGQGANQVTTQTTTSAAITTIPSTLTNAYQTVTTQPITATTTMPIVQLSTTIPISTTATSTSTNGVVLTITYGSIVKTLTLTDVESFQGMQDMGGQKSTNGTIAIYQGVKLTDLLAKVEPGGLTEGQSATVTGGGGQAVTFTYDQITNGGFTTFDSSGNVTTPVASLATTPIIGIAYMVSGNMLSNGSPGPLELGIFYGQPLFTNSALWVPMVTTIKIIDSGATNVNASTINVTYGSVTRTYVMADIQTLLATLGYGGPRTQSGTVNNPPDYLYTSVALTDVIKGTAASPGVEPGGLTTGQSVIITGVDGYSVTFTYGQIMNGNFPTYNISGSPTTLAPTNATVPVIAILYWANGNGLNSSTGPFELGIIYGQPLLTDASNWIKMVTTINVISSVTTTSTATAGFFPSNGATNVPVINLTFTWPATSGSSITYQFALAQASANTPANEFAILDYSDNTLTNAEPCQETLQYGTVYWWEVRSVTMNSSGAMVSVGSWTIQMFTTAIK